MLSIIIVNYNVKYFTEQCLYSVQRAVAGIDAEVIVVDNNSADGSVDYLQQIFSWVKYVSNQNNIGYAKANNQGLQLAKGNYVLFLNPDTLLSEECLQKSITLLDNNSNAGALGIHMVDGTGQFLPESKRGFPSVAASFFKLSGLIRFFPKSRRVGAYYLGWLPEKQTSEVEVLSGAYMMVKQEVLAKTGGFDEQFFMYGEDIDLSYRIRQLGYQNYYLGESSIVHFKGESTRKDIRYTKLFYRAMMLFVQKHYGQSGMFTGLMRAAIAVRGSLSFGGQLFSGGTREKIPGLITHTLVVGEPAATVNATEILMRQPEIRRKISGVVNLVAIETAGTTGIHEVVFCAGTIPYSDIIKTIERLKAKKISFKFSYAGSKCIVGSGSRNSSGEALVLKGKKQEQFIQEGYKKKKGPE